MLGRTTAGFDRSAFMNAALDGYDSAGLMDRARLLAKALAVSLPGDFPNAVQCIVASLGPELTRTDSFGMEPFVYLPFTFFVAEHGLAHFDVSMQAQYELTKRCTVEFSIRPFLVHHERRTIAVLAQWALDSNPHVRRLVSEGTRPRLPWAPRLERFQKDPGPVINLLEVLKDDPVEYVRRSVANNLNDIGKDNPDVLLGVSKRWMSGADELRYRLLRHALRTAVKGRDRRALSILGFGGASSLRLRRAHITPARAVLGQKVRIEFEVANVGHAVVRANIDIVVHFIKKSGRSLPRVFKGCVASVLPKAEVKVSRTIALRDMTTRKHYPGLHRVSVQINGRLLPVGVFRLGK